MLLLLRHRDSLNEATEIRANSVVRLGYEVEVAIHKTPPLANMIYNMAVSNSYVFSFKFYLTILTIKMCQVFENKILLTVKQKTN